MACKLTPVAPISRLASVTSSLVASRICDRACQEGGCWGVSPDLPPVTSRCARHSDHDG